VGVSESEVLPKMAYDFLCRVVRLGDSGLTPHCNRFCLKILWCRSDLQQHETGQVKGRELCRLVPCSAEMDRAAVRTNHLRANANNAVMFAGRSGNAELIVGFSE
jgi:hypothetical protein